METKGNELANEYSVALRNYLAGGGEPALQRAFELGRKAVKEGLGSIDLAMVHHNALADTMEDAPQPGENTKLVELGSNFFAEILAPIEMSHRGYQATLESLPESEERYRTLVESARDVIFMLSTHGIITSLNPVFEAITGWRREEWIGKHFVGLVQHEDLKVAIEMFERSLKGEIPPVFELHLVSNNRGAVVGEFKITPKLQDGKTVGVFGIAADITERKKAEEQLKEQAWLLEAAHDAIVVCNLDDTITFWNRSAEQLYGWERNQALGRSLGEIMLHRDQGEFIRARRDALEHNEWQGQLRQRTKDGAEVLVESRWSLVRDMDGNAGSILIVNTDITDKKKLESRLLRFHRMETIGKLAIGIAHDLNDVLAPILLGVQTLAKSLPGEEGGKIVSTIETSITRGANMIKQVLTFARGIGEARTVLQLGTILTNVVDFAKETFPKSIEFKTNVSESMWPIRGEQAQVEQLLMNLCINARDAMPHGGCVTVEAGNITFDENYALMNPEARPGPYVIVTVSDTGTALAAETIEKVFDPFTKTADRTGAPGLGLSTAYSIVRSHDGFIRVASDPERGTRFSVYLPATETTVLREGKDQKGDLPTGNGELILVVDDEAAIREITKATLETYGYRVITANDGSEAVAIYSDRMEQIKLVFTDIMMQCMNGDNAIRSIVLLNPDAKIITTSGLTSADQVRERIGMQDIVFLPKPYTAAKLISTIRSVLSAPTRKSSNVQKEATCSPLS